jgi:MoaA/NifB/PqqE/SkfB family radical SAM enzyme
VMITNGSLVTPEAAQRIAQSGNMIALVSIEGLGEKTDDRRRAGAYKTAVGALDTLGRAGALFGFAAMNTTANTAHLGSDEFIDEMIGLGCCVGYFTEYVPCGPSPEPDWALDEGTRAAFRERVLDLRRRKRFVLMQFPHDEYGDGNRCSAAGRDSVHINPQGEIEPCPFVPIACESIRDGGLRAACESPFLKAIRDDPALLQRHHFACSLFEHREKLERLAAALKPTASR